MLLKWGATFLLTVIVTAHSFLLPTVAILPLFVGIGAASGNRATVILVPGLYHEPTAYNKVVGVLRRSQYKRVFPIDLPSVGSMRGRDDDVAAVRTVLIKELEEGRDVVLVGNSYGGTVISEAVKGLKKATRATVVGRSLRPRGRVRGLIYLSGFLPYIQDVLHPELRPDPREISPLWIRFTEDGKVYPDGDPANPPSVLFYNDLPEKEANFWTSKLQFSSFNSVAANSTYIPYTGDFECYYIIGKKDNTIPQSVAETWINQEGAKFEVDYLDAGHIPMLSQPENVARIIRNVAEKNTVAN
jgi:pimeloyl-ACP methyl ester carboxylesterase